MSQKGMGDLVKQIGRMRKEIDRVQESLKERYVEASAADGRVEVTCNGQQELVKVSIAPEFLSGLIGAGGVVDDAARETLEDLIVAAVNQCLEKSKKLMSEELDSATGGLASGLPGLF